MKFPLAVIIIVVIDFINRFTSFLKQSSLSLYLVEILHYPQDAAMIIYHVNMMLVFFFPLLGSIISESWLGRYRSILYLTIIYALGEILLMLSSTPWFEFSAREVAMPGLFLIAFGSGSIKSCIPPFGSDQFKLPEEEHKISDFVQLSFLMKVCGALISAGVSPIMRKDVYCFGSNTCYPLVYLVPSILLVLVVGMYLLGKPLYKIKKPEGNVIIEVFKCIICAIGQKFKSKTKRTHWLDHADHKFSPQLIEDTKTMIGIFKIYGLLSVLYCIQFQNFSRWTLQASHMNGEFLGYNIKADQIRIVEPVLLILFLPTLKYIIYPIIEKLFFINTLLRKLTTGGFLMATAFLISGILELTVEPTYMAQPLNGMAQLRIFNTINCPVNFTLDGQIQEVETLGLYQNLKIPTNGHASLKYSVDIECPNIVHSNFTGIIGVEEMKSLTYLLKRDSLEFGMVEQIERSVSGDPKIRAVIFTDTGVPANLKLGIRGKKNYHLNLTKYKPFTEFIEVLPDSYKIHIDGNQVKSDVSLSVGGIYTIVGRFTSNSKVLNIVTVDQPYSIHMFWQLPQYIILSLSIVITTTNALEFALSQAPARMKTVVVAISFISEGLGNLWVIAIQKAHFFERPVHEIFLYAGLLYVDMIIFAVVAMFYKYADPRISGEKEISEKSNI